MKKILAGCGQVLAEAARRMTSAYIESPSETKALTILSDEEDKETKARRVVRANNFTQQTNALDVDKHMYAILSMKGCCANRSWSGWRTLKRT